MTEEVTQADREAAAAYINGGRGAIPLYEAALIEEIREGERDKHPLVQAFAAHRLAHLPTDLSEERAREIYDDSLRLEHLATGMNTPGYARRSALRAMHQYAAGLQGALVEIRDMTNKRQLPLTTQINDIARTALGDTQS